MTKNEIKLSLEIIPPSEIKLISSIPFTNCALIKIFIDDISVSDAVYIDSVVVFEELKKSILSDRGRFLIFTEASGIADDGGWDYVSVIHENDNTKWILEYNNNTIEYLFDKNEYYIQIENLNNKVLVLDKNIIVEPSFVIFPEDDF